MQSQDVVAALIRENRELRERNAQLEGFGKTMTAALSKIREMARMGRIPTAKGLMAFCDVAINDAMKEGYASRNAVSGAMPKGIILPPGYAPGHVQRRSRGR